MSRKRAATCAAAPRALGVFQVAAVGARVLRDDDELLDARLDQPLRFAQHVGSRARDERPAQARDDAEGAAVVAAFGDLEIGVVARRQPHAFAGDEIDERIVRRGRRRAHRLHHALERLRAGDRRDVGKSVTDRVGLGAHAAGDDDAPVLVHRRADRGERFLFRAVEKAAGVDDDRVGAGVAARKLVALGAQPREDALAVDERLRAAERDEGNARRRAALDLGGVGHPGRLPRARRRGKEFTQARRVPRRLEGRHSGERPRGAPPLSSFLTTSRYCSAAWIRSGRSHRKFASPSIKIFSSFGSDPTRTTTPSSDRDGSGFWSCVNCVTASSPARAARCRSD